MTGSFRDSSAEGCRLCPRECCADRESGQRGFCRAGALPVIVQAGPHHGEEPVLSGRMGSGTIFLAGCNLHCVFCQNYDISAEAEGRGVDENEVARTALALQDGGCHNINFVTPSHHADLLAKAIPLARSRGLAVPVVYNCGGYESQKTLRLLDGLVEIYMPDVKFFDREACRRYLNAPDYGIRVKEALKTMQAQVGDLVVRDGLAVRGLLVRHLVMPGFSEDSFAILEFIASEVSKDACVNVMGQYWPTPGASRFPELRRSVGRSEVDKVRSKAESLGLRLCP